MMALLSTINVFAYDIAVENDDGVTIYYNYINEGQELEVTHKHSGPWTGTSSDGCYSGTIIIPEEVTFMNRKRKVTSIGSHTFRGCMWLTSVTISNNVTSIGNMAFYQCIKLTSVTIPNSVSSIGTGVFRDCSGLTSITIPNSVTIIGEKTFSYCTGLTSVTIPNSVTSIGEQAFYGCSALTSVTIPNSVTSIENSAFSGCTSLTSVTIPTSVTSIGVYAFYGCSGLTSITIPNSVTSIEEGAFKGCTGLTSITIPNSVTNIGSHAFYGCESLLSVTLGESVGYINYQAFYNCRNLKDVICLAKEVPSASTDFFRDEGGYDRSQFSTLYVLTESLDAYKGTEPWSRFMNIEAFDLEDAPNPVVTLAVIDGINYHVNTINRTAEVRKLPKNQKYTGVVVIPAAVTYDETICNVTGIGQSAFQGCTELTSVIIGNNVTTIVNNAFSGCGGLTSVTLGKSMIGINDETFSSFDIASVISFIEEPFVIHGKTSENRTFSLNTFNNATLYVPVGSIDKYKTTEGWKDFLFMEEGDGGGSTPDPGPNPETKRCAKPTIHYFKGKLTFECETEGAICTSTITDSDITSYSGNEVQLGITYYISVYATKAGLENSETATATLCWIDVDPQTEGITGGEEDAVTEVKAAAVLIQSEGNTLTINGAPANTPIAVYDLGGRLIGNATAVEGTTSVQTATSEKVVIVRVGERSIKVALK